MSRPYWSRETISAEIRANHEAGNDLSYSAVHQSNVSLMRAAVRYFGSWRAAVEFAGLNYDEIRRYKSWSRERIISRIKELHAQGADLSWYYVSHQLDPQLASAAIREKAFGSWRKALEASGLDYDAVRRYREWSDELVLDMVHELHENGKDLNAKSMEEQDLALLTAARRRFDAWHQTLRAAGLDYRDVVQRQPFKRYQKAGV